MKIFNFGLPRTGTQSFHQFLINNDINSLHSNHGEINKIFPIEYIKFLNDEPSIIDLYIETYEAFSDLPWYSLYKKIIDKYHTKENIHFVATIRPSVDRWHKSILKILHEFKSNAIMYHRYFYGHPLNNLYNKKYATRIYHNHYDNLKVISEKYNIKIHFLDFNDTDHIINTIAEICDYQLHNITYPHIK